jgi:predicted nucleic acid-binding protein
LSTYVDTSFLVSLYLTDKHTALAESAMASNPSVWLTPLHVAEWTHAIEQHVFRGTLSRAEAESYYGRFAQHRAAGVWVAVTLPDTIFDVCARLGRRYGARLGLRTLDTLHVASAIELKARRFWTFDERQKKLARAAGLKTG